MVGMWIVLAAVVVLIVVVAIFAAVRRPRGDDLNSVQSYHTALGTLEHLADRHGPAPVRPATPAVQRPPAAPPSGRHEPDVADDPDVAKEPDEAGSPTPERSAGSVTDRSEGKPAGRRSGSAGTAPRSYRRPDAYVSTVSAANPPGTTGTPSTAAGTPPVPPVPLRVDGQLPDPSVPLVFDDARPKDRSRPEIPPEGVPAHRTDRAQRNALHSMNHRRRRGSTVMIVVAAVVIFGVLAYVGSRRSGTGHPSHAATHATSTTTGSTRPTSTTAATSRAGTAKKKHTKPTPTTVPTQIVAVSSTASRAIYPVGSDAYSLNLSASGPCWVDATTVATGSTLWTGTMQAGGSQVIHATGAVTVELGSPSVSIALNGVPVVFPTPIQAPFTAAFQPAAVASGSVATTTSVAATTTVPGAGSTATP